MKTRMLNVCPEFGKDCDPKDPECRACHLQLQCLEGMRGYIKLRVEEVRQTHQGGNKFLDELPQDIRPAVESIVADLLAQMEEEQSPTTKGINTCISTWLKEEGILDPFVAGWVMDKLLETWTEEEGKWRKR